MTTETEHFFTFIRCFFCEVHVFSRTFSKSSFLFLIHLQVFLKKKNPIDLYIYYTYSPILSCLFTLFIVFLMHKVSNFNTSKSIHQAFFGFLFKKSFPFLSLFSALKVSRMPLLSTVHGPEVFQLQGSRQKMQQKLKYEQGKWKTHL